MPICVMALLRHPVAVAFGVACLFSFRFVDALPCSRFSKIFNQETVAAFASYLMFA